MTWVEGCPSLNFSLNGKIYQVSVFCTSCHFQKSYRGSDNGISNLNQYELTLACLQLGSYSLEAASPQQTATDISKREKAGKGALFNPSAVLPTQHSEKLVETKRERKLMEATASFPIPSNLLKQCSHVACGRNLCSSRLKIIRRCENWAADQVPRYKHRRKRDDPSNNMS